jgi:hypothetical protein
MSRRLLFLYLIRRAGRKGGRFVELHYLIILIVEVSLGATVLLSAISLPGFTSTVVSTIIAFLAGITLGNYIANANQWPNVKLHENQKVELSGGNLEKFADITGEAYTFVVKSNEILKLRFRNRGNQSSSILIEGSYTCMVRGFRCETLASVKGIDFSWSVFNEKGKRIDSVPIAGGELVMLKAKYMRISFAPQFKDKNVTKVANLNMDLMIYLESWPYDIPIRIIVNPRNRNDP